MGLLDKLLGRKKEDLSKSDRYRMIPPEKDVTEEQQTMNRDLMESQMEESRQKRQDEADAEAERKDSE